MTNKLSSKALIAEMSEDQPQLSKIKQYLAEGADIDYQSEEDGYTALMLAVDRDDEPLVNYLLQYNANPLIRNHYKEVASDIALSYSPIYNLLKNNELLFAAVTHDFQAVKAALDSEANINFQGRNGYSALMIAVEESCLKIVELLMNHRANLFLKTEEGAQALDLASDRIIYKTLTFGKPLTDEQKRKFLEQCEDEEEAMTDNDRTSKAFFTEISKELPQLEKVENYLVEGADINFQSAKDGYTALMLAVEKKNEPRTIALLQQGANPFLQNHSQQTASDLVESNTTIYKLLKNHELLFATKLEDREKVKDALEKGADINFQGKGGYTAIMIAVESNNLEMVELLITYKPNFYRKTDNGRTVYSFLRDRLIHKTLQVYKPLTDKEKEAFFKAINTPLPDYEENYEQGRLKMLADRKERPFNLDQLEFEQVKAPATNEDIEALQEYIGHPLPELYKEICRNFNGGRPNVCFYDDEEGRVDEIGYFRLVNNDKSHSNNIWNSIENFSSELGRDCLPFASDSSNRSIFYLKWTEDNVEVWRLLWGDLAYEFDDEYYDDDSDEMKYIHVLINKSFDTFMETLYAVEGI